MQGRRRNSRASVEDSVFAVPVFVDIILRDAVLRRCAPGLTGAFWIAVRARECLINIQLTVRPAVAVYITREGSIVKASSGSRPTHPSRGPSPRPASALAAAFPPAGLPDMVTATAYQELSSSSRWRRRSRWVLLHQDVVRPPYRCSS